MAKPHPRQRQELLLHRPTLVPLQTASEIDGMIKDNPDLTSAEIETLRTIGARHAKQLRARLIDLDAKAYADALSLSDLRALAIFERSEAAAHRLTRALSRTTRGDPSLLALSKYSARSAALTTPRAVWGSEWCI